MPPLRPYSNLEQSASARNSTLSIVAMERRRAIGKHGPLQGGMDRWIHHLNEECQEAVAEMAKMGTYHNNKMPIPTGVRANLITELAQVAQLAEGMLELLAQNREFEGEETWQGK